MRPRPVLLLCPALLLLALAWSLAGVRAPLPTGDEATSVMIVQSLWHDHDLAYREPDLARAGRLWDGGPAGLTLFTDDGGKTLRYGRPVAYPLAALPFYALFGARGIALFNMALFLAMACAALWHFSRRSPLSSSPASSSPRRHSPTPSGWNPASFSWPASSSRCSSGSACGISRNREEGDFALLAGAGVLLGAALTSSPLLALLGLPIADRPRGAAPLARARGLRRRGAPRGRAPRPASSAPARGSGPPSEAFSAVPSRPSSRSRARATSGRGTATRRRPSLATGLRLLPRNLWYLLAGRFTGLLPYFPFALFALGLYLVGPKDRSRHLLLGALLVYAGLVLAGHPHDFGGAPGFSRQPLSRAGLSGVPVPARPSPGPPEPRDPLRRRRALDRPGAHGAKPRGRSRPSSACRSS